MQEFTTEEIDAMLSHAKRYRRTKSSIKESCDQMAAMLCRNRGRCQRCKSVQNLQWSHIKSRRFLSIRWDEDNCLCMCASCHRWWHDHPDESGQWFAMTFPDQYKRLQRKFQPITKLSLLDYLLIEADLKKKTAYL